MAQQGQQVALPAPDVRLTKQGGIALTDLDLEQLAQVKQQLEEEVQHLTQSFATLKSAESKFKAAKSAADHLTKPSAEGEEVLVPLTPSLYVPGKLKNVDRVMVDIGTGYYVQKTTVEARTFYNTKLLGLRKNLDELQPVIERKRDNLRSVNEVIEYRAAQERGAVP